MSELPHGNPAVATVPSAAQKKPVVAYVLGALLLLAAATGVGLGVIKLIKGPP